MTTDYIKCDHIEAGARTERIIPIGKHRSVQLCAECEAILKGDVFQDVINHAVKNFVKDAIRLK
jgi:hypothetical protein